MQSFEMGLFISYYINQPPLEQYDKDLRLLLHQRNSLKRLFNNKNVTRERENGSGEVPHEVSVVDLNWLELFSNKGSSRIISSLL